CARQAYSGAYYYSSEDYW
nr:immunoglobulin heavy chain junction region [Macaca mulatta]